LKQGPIEGSDFQKPIDFSGDTAIQRSLPGVNTGQIRQIDAAHNISAATTFTFTLDRSRPAAPQVNLVRNTGFKPSAIVTSVAALVVRGLERSGRVEYSGNGRSWNAASTPTEGRNMIRVRQIDVAGNTSLASRALAFRLDTKPSPRDTRLPGDAAALKSVLLHAGDATATLHGTPADLVISGS